jgi:fumarylacetoacetate (FAA) hydrolase family protein
MIIQAITSLRPNSTFSLMGDTYDTLIWQDSTTTAPTKTEVDAEVIRLQAKYDATEYQRKRAAEYPSIGDQLDALWKGGDAAEEMLAKVQAVKTKYPKE